MDGQTDETKDRRGTAALAHEATDAASAAATPPQPPAAATNADGGGIPRAFWNSNKTLAEICAGCNTKEELAAAMD